MAERGRPMTAAERQRRHREKLKVEKQSVQREKWRVWKRKQRTRNAPLNIHFQGQSCSADCDSSKNNTSTNKTLVSPLKHDNGTVCLGESQSDIDLLTSDFAENGRGDAADIQPKEKQMTYKKKHSQSDTCKLNKNHCEIGNSRGTNSINVGFGTSCADVQYSASSASCGRPLTAAERQRNYRARLKKKREIEEQKLATINLPEAIKECGKHKKRVQALNSSLNTQVDGQSSNGLVQRRRPLTAAERQRNYRDRLKKKNECVENQKTADIMKCYEKQRGCQKRKTEMNPYGLGSKLCMTQSCGIQLSSSEAQSLPLQTENNGGQRNDITDGRSKCNSNNSNNKKIEAKPKGKHNIRYRPKHSERKAHCSVGYAPEEDELTVGSSKNKYVQRGHLSNSLEHVVCADKFSAPEPFQGRQLRVSKHGKKGHGNNASDEKLAIRRAKGRERTRNYRLRMKEKAIQIDPSVHPNNIKQHDHPFKSRGKSKLKSVPQVVDLNKSINTDEVDTPKHLGRKAYTALHSPSSLHSVDILSQKQAVGNIQEMDPKSLEGLKYLNQVHDTDASTHLMTWDVVKRTQEREKKRRYRRRVKERNNAVPIISAVWSVCTDPIDPMMQHLSSPHSLQHKIPLTAAERQRNYRERMKLKKHMEDQKLGNESKRTGNYSLMQQEITNQNSQHKNPLMDGQNADVAFILELGKQKTGDNTVLDKILQVNGKGDCMSQPFHQSLQPNFLPEDVKVKSNDCLISAQDMDTNAVQSTAKSSSSRPMTAAERQRKYRERMRQSPEKLALIKQKRQERYQSNKHCLTQKQMEKIRNLNMVRSRNYRIRKKQRKLLGTPDGRMIMQLSNLEDGDDLQVTGETFKITSPQPTNMRPKRRYENMKKSLQCYTAYKPKDALKKQNSRKFMTPEQIERCRKNDRERQRRFRAKKRGLVLDNGYPPDDPLTEDPCNKSVSPRKVSLRSAYKAKPGHPIMQSMITDQSQVEVDPEISEGSNLVSDVYKDILLSMKEDIGDDSSLWTTVGGNIAELSSIKEFVVSSAGNIPILVKAADIKEEFPNMVEETAEVIPCDPPHTDNYNWADIPLSDSTQIIARDVDRGAMNEWEDLMSDEREEVGVVSGSARRKAFLPTRCHTTSATLTAPNPLQNASHM